MNAPIIDEGLPPMPAPTARQTKAWGKWAASRPDPVRKVCERFPPWHYYDMPKTGQIVVVRAYSEDGTMRVLIVGDRISVPAILPFEVFGVPAEDLEVRTPHA